MDQLEKTLDEAFVKKAPVQLPENLKKWLVEYSPYIGLIFGIIGVLLTLGFWRVGHTLNDVLNNLDSINRAYGVDTGLRHTHLGVAYWLALISLGGWSVLNVVAFPALKARRKAGWNLLFYAMLVNMLYDVFYGLYYSNVFDIIIRLIGATIGLYVLFQIRSYYLGTKAGVKANAVASKPAAESPAVSEKK